MCLAIAHKGFWWPRRELQNHPDSVLGALTAGYGAEVDVWDVRDLRLVLRHDESSLEHELTPLLFMTGPLFLHAKGGNGGFPERLADTIRAWGRPDTYTFCSPSNDALLATMRVASIKESPIKTLVPVDSLDRLTILLDQWDILGVADGVWLEQPETDWVDADTIDNIKGAGKTVWIVSPELHGRSLDLGRLAEWRTADGICTDYPHLLVRVMDRDDVVVHPKEPWWE